MQAIPTSLFESKQYQNLSVFRDANAEALYMSMNARPRPCFTWSLVRDILEFQKSFASVSVIPAMRPRCLVLASSAAGLFSLGGDLQLFRSVIEAQDRDTLAHYAEDCVSVLYNHMWTPETVTVSLLQGDALGAGLESALASDIVIAERGMRGGFPEVLFNLVPGHGALYLLARRIGLSAAEKMIRAGGVHSAEELHAMGVVDILVGPGEGRGAVRDLLERESKSWNALRALQHIKRHHLPVTREALSASARIWVDSAMQLSERNLRMMERLVHAQERRLGSTVRSGTSATAQEARQAAA